MKYRCMSCMEEFEGNVCPKCGYVRGIKAAEPHHMPPESILHKKYIIGKVLGFGGFGVTYIAWDAMLNQKVAIKEYLPSEFATRIPGNTEVSVYEGRTKDLFKSGLKSFIDEAQRLAKFSSDDGIVKIYDTFNENNTAYIVMEYLEGETVASMLKRKGALSYQEALDIITPVLRALSSIHLMGIVHRDISPDNIFITKDGRVKVLDFGSARYATAYNSKSLSVIIKRGYAPPEQYIKNGQQGPWTDNYATAATMYKLLTGKTPTEAIDRKEHPLAPPSSMGVAIPQRSENALMNALNLDPGARPQTAQDFLNGLVAGTTRVVEKKEKDKTKFPLWLKILSASVALLVVVVGTLFATGVVKIANGKLIFPYASVEEGYVRVPDVLGESKDSAEQILEDKELEMLITGKKEYDDVEKDLICEQTPIGGDKSKIDDNVEVVISSGPRVAYVPGALYHTKDAAIASMKAEGFKVKVKKEYSDEVGKDGVISQSEAENSELEYKDKITIVVSKGSKNEYDGQVEIGDLTGKNFEETRKALLEKGVYLLAEVSEYSDEVKEDAIISQQTAKGTKIDKGETVYVTVSLGKEKVRIPDLQYMTEEEATKTLEDLGLKVKTVRDHDQFVEDGRVIAQEKAKGELVLKGSEFTITINTQKKIPAILPTEAVNIYMENKDVWISGTEYSDGITYSFLDLNFDGVLELMVDAFGGRHFSSQHFYEIDIVTKQVKEVSGSAEIYGDGNGTGFNYGNDTLLLKNKNDGTFSYYASDSSGSDMFYSGTVNGLLFLKEGELTTKLLFRQQHFSGEGLYAPKKGDFYSYYENSEWVEISKSEYDEKVEVFNSENTDLHLKWESIPYDDLAGASSSKQKEMLYEAYKAFSYDGYVFYDEEPKEEAPKEEPKPTQKLPKITQAAQIGEVNGVIYATRRDTATPTDMYYLDTRKGAGNIPTCKTLPIETEDRMLVSSFSWYDGYVYYVVSGIGTMDYSTYLYRCKDDWTGKELIAKREETWGSNGPIVSGDGGDREFFIEDGVLYYGKYGYKLPSLEKVDASNATYEMSYGSATYNDIKLTDGSGGLYYDDGNGKTLISSDGSIDGGYACGYIYYSKFDGGGAILYRYNIKTGKSEEVDRIDGVGGGDGPYFCW